jgi:glycine/D-amino acid oxidase-like deaminating enzyme
MHMKKSVAVIGAGPVGLAAAAHLRERGPIRPRGRACPPFGESDAGAHIADGVGPIAVRAR